LFCSWTISSIKRASRILDAGAGMLDVQQIFGRAGRPQYEDTGLGIIITQHTSLSHYLGMLTHQLPIESQFISKLADNLNAEIVLGSPSPSHFLVILKSAVKTTPPRSQIEAGIVEATFQPLNHLSSTGTVTNIKEAVTWLGYTYLFVRMKKEHLHYGTSLEELASDPELMQKRRALVTKAAKELESSRMARFHEGSGSLYVTDMGRVASHFYIRHSSVLIYNELLKPRMTEAEVSSTLTHFN
jgi:activating signal cointegrator complex subunit 3